MAVKARGSGGEVRGCRHASVAWLHTCDVWSGLCSLEALVGTEGATGLASGRKCQEDTPKSSHTLRLMPGLAVFTSLLWFIRVLLLSKYATPAWEGAPSVAYWLLPGFLDPTG